MTDWYEPGGKHQVPIVTADLSLVIRSLLEQIDNMDRDNLMWLYMASDNMMKLCQMAAGKLDTEE